MKSPSRKQIAALADAHSQSGHGKTGLVCSGKRWFIDDDRYASSHSHRTVQSLVERGLLRLYAGGSVAHITDSGIEILEVSKGER